MTQKKTYIRWLGIGCVALAVFAIAIMAVGYQPLTIGRGATVVVLIAGAIACLTYARSSTKPQ